MTEVKILGVPPVSILSWGDIALRKAEGYQDGECPMCGRAVLIGPRVWAMSQIDEDASIRCMICCAADPRMQDAEVRNLGGRP